MEIPVVVSVFLLSLLAPGVLYTINNVPAIQDALPLLGLGAAVLGTVQLLMFLSVRSKKNVDPLYYVFAEFCFTCVVGLTNALEQDGYISGFMTFYIKKGEPHLSTAYAVMMCYWEGVVHFLLLLTMIHRMFRGKSYRNLGLLWVGSSIAHQIIFVPGVVIGERHRTVYTTSAIMLLQVNMAPTFIPPSGGMRPSCCCPSGRLSCSSIGPETCQSSRMPTDRRWKVLLLNLVFLSGPVLLALRCHARPAFFMKLCC